MSIKSGSEEKLPLFIACILKKLKQKPDQYETISDDLAFNFNDFCPFIDAFNESRL